VVRVVDLRWLVEGERKVAGSSSGGGMHVRTRAMEVKV